VTHLNNKAPSLCLYNIGQPEQALSLYDQVLAIHRKAYGDDNHPKVAISLSNNQSECLHEL
jgi:hypothetical protein